MRKFEFPLHAALRWRQRQLEQEELLTKQRAAELRAIEMAIEELDSERERADRHILELHEVAARDLEALARYREGARQRQMQLLESKRVAEDKLEKQRLRMLEARRQVKLLEKVRERRLEAWQAEFNKEIENLAAEVYLAQWPPVERGQS